MAISLDDPVRAGSEAEGLPRVDLLGIAIHAIDEAECVDHIIRESCAGRGGWVATPNLDHLRRLTRDAGFRDLCSRASLLVPDGIPLLWAARLQGTPFKGRVAGSDLLGTLSHAAAEKGRSLFLLGGDSGTAEAAVRVLQGRDENLRVVGTHCPEVGFEKCPDKMSALTDQLEAARPDIIFVGLGSPKQEILMDRLAPHLPTTWWVGVGISFSFLCGDVTRAPRWMQRSGLEWAHRLLQEPRRLVARYLVRGIPFALVLFSRSAWRRFKRRPE